MALPESTGADPKFIPNLSQPPSRWRAYPQQWREAYAFSIYHKPYH